MLGQILDASVIGRDGKNSIRLRIDGAEVRAATALPLQKGERLTLRVTQLKPVVTLSPALERPSPERAQVRSALVKTLPRQQPLQPLLEHLSALSKSRTAQSADHGPSGRLPATLAEAANRVLRTVPSLAEISNAARLPSVLRRAGLFAESTVAQQQQPAPGANRVEPPVTDLKWQLLRLRGELDKAANRVVQRDQALTNAAPETQLATKPRSSAAQRATVQNSITQITMESDAEAEPIRKLSQLVDGAIARIETNQLKAVSALLDADVQVALDIPVAVKGSHEVIRLQISRDSPEPDGATVAETTTIVIEVPVDNDAVMRAVINMAGEDLTVKLWSTNAGLRQTIAVNRESLAQRLRANGLDNVSIALVELQPFEAWSKKFDRLVDVQA